MQHTAHILTLYPVLLGGTVESLPRRENPAVLRPIKRNRTEKPLHPVVILVARVLTTGAIVGLLIAHNAFQEWMLRQLMQSQATQRDFFLENLPLVFPFVAGVLLIFVTSPRFPYLGPWQFKSSTFVCLFLVPFYLMLGPWIGLALELSPGQLWIVGGSGAVRLAPLFALVAGAGLAAAFTER